MTDAKRAPEGGRYDTHVSKDEYAAFLGRTAPDRRCHVCGHDKFTIVTAGDEAAVFDLSHSAELFSKEFVSFECFAHYCDRCGTVTETAAHVVVEARNA